MMSWSKISMWTLFTIIMLFVAFAVSSMITLRWTATTAASGWVKVLIACGIAFLFMSPFTLRGPNSGLTGWLMNTATYITYFLFVCVFLFFCLMIIRDIAWFIGHILISRIPSPFAASAVLKANIGLLILVVFLSGYSLYEGTRIPRLKEITLYSDKIKEPLKVALLPDIHIHRALSAQKLKGIIELTNSQHPDVIALPGDIIDDRADTIADLVPMLASFRAPLGVYVTDGNHEIYIGTQNAQAAFHQTNLTYLYNESRLVRPDVRVAGVPDIQSARLNRAPDMTQALAPDNTFTILLAHTPKMFDLPGNTADLQVSGHTHGGQIFPFHILAQMANRYLSGLFERDGRYLYVSRGAGQWGPQMRLFAPSEITLITILPQQ